MHSFLKWTEYALLLGRSICRHIDIVVFLDGLELNLRCIDKSIYVFQLIVFLIYVFFRHPLDRSTMMLLTAFQREGAGEDKFSISMAEIDQVSNDFKMPALMMLFSSAVRTGVKVRAHAGQRYLLERASV